MGKKGAVRVKQIGGKAPALPPALLDPSQFLAQQQPQEEIHLPPPPDRSYQIKWPLALANLSATGRTHDVDAAEYFVVYPAYLDATRSIARGRRLPADMALAPPPSVMDLSQALQRLNVEHVIQPYKGYPRDRSVWDNPGRVLVRKAAADAAAVVGVMAEDAAVDRAGSGTYRRQALLRQLAQAIPGLPERVARLQREAAEQEQYEAEARAYQAQQQTASSSSTGAASKANAPPSLARTNKKNKKGRK